MKNIDMIRYQIEYAPHRFNELLDDIYCIGFNHGSRTTLIDESEELEFSDSDWLHQEVERDMFTDNEIAEATTVLNK